MLSRKVSKIVVSIFLACLLVCSFWLLKMMPGKNQMCQVTSTYSTTAFQLAYNNKVSTIFIDTSDAEVVKIAAGCLQHDIQMVTGLQPEISAPRVIDCSYPIIIGTIENSTLIKKLIESGVIEENLLKGKWESFVIKVIDKPFGNIKKALVIAGSDRRGTAFGVFELSKMIGISPWVWWADVVPAKKKSLFITPGSFLSGQPSVKYRGIFLNDEDWGLQPWAAKHLDTTIHDIGPSTYAHIFELLLRLKANFIWPAMHICTKAFYYYPENPKTAERYAIVVGSSHCEPILRDNLFEWSVNFEKEYGIKPREWRYDKNKAQIFRYWDDRAKQSSSYESVYTIGMRGIHDSSMPGAKSTEDKVSLLNQVIVDQREILSHRKGISTTEIPQIFCPYKEVLTLYQNGLKVPDDITIVWADDNHGYIRQLSNEAEQQRRGRSGVYYHFSYWGSPYDYLWLSSTSPSLTAYEMFKAYSYGADRLWIFNVGDIKPAEMETEFAMDMAWDINKWTPQNAYKYAEEWAARTFGNDFAKPIAAIKAMYYRLSQNGKPEHLGVLDFSDYDAMQRIKDYNQLVLMCDDLKRKISPLLLDAYFQLIYYPVKAAALQNEKIFFARKSLELAKIGDTSALLYSKKASLAFAAIKQLTFEYNHVVSNGKWEGMMCYNPRNLAVFKMPQIATPEMLRNFSANMVSLDSNSFVNGKYDIDLIETRVKASTNFKKRIAASSFHKKHLVKGQTIEVIPQLGLNGSGISLFPFIAASIPDSLITEASYVEYNIYLEEGYDTIVVKLLPTHAVQKERGVRYGISVNNDMVQVVNLNFPAESPVWKENVIRGYSIGQTVHKLGKSKRSLIRIYFPDPGVVINQIEIK